MAFSCLLFNARLIAIVRQRVTNNSKSHWSVNERGIGCLKHSSLHARLTDWGKGSWNNKEGRIMGSRQGTDYSTHRLFSDKFQV